MSKFDSNFAATVLLEAIYADDKTVCAKYALTDRTLRNYRTRLASDADFSAIFHTRKKILDEAWAEEIPVALKKALRFIVKATETADARNPMVIDSITNAIRVIADVQMTGRWIDARIGNSNRETAELLGQGDSVAEVASPYKN